MTTRIIITSYLLSLFYGNLFQDLKICDYPYRVDCKGLPSNPEPIETGTEIEPNTTYAPEVSATTSSTSLSSAESSPVTEVVQTISTGATPVADPIAMYNYNLRKIPPSRPSIIIIFIYV